MRPLITLIAIIFCSYLTTAQQAWTKEKGKYFAQVGTSFLGYNSLIDAETKKIVPLNRDFVDMSASLYGEYGITDYLTVSGQIPFKYSASSKGVDKSIKDGSISGLSNINLMLTGRLFQKGGAVVSTKFRVGLPTGSYDDATGLRTGFDATTYAPSLLVGAGFSKFFTSAEFGREFRNNGYTNRNIIGWQIGKFFANRKFIGILAVEAYTTIGESKYDDKNSRATALYLSTQSYISPSLKFGYYVKPQSTVWLSVGVGLPGTDDIPASPGISISFSKTNQ
jgi:hypothetical protein